MARSPSKSQFPCVTTAGGLLPADFLLTLKAGIERQSGSDLPGLQPGDYHLGGETFGEATNRAWNALQGRWEHFKAYLDGKDESDTTHGETWDRFLRPLFRELGYGQLDRDLTVEIDTDTYKITHRWREVAIHLLGAGVSIDKRTLGVEGAAKKSPHAMVQEFLNRSENHLWAFVSNGLHLRILRDNVSLTRQAYVEFDLSAMFEGGEYGDFQLLWLLCHQSRVEGIPQETCWLERWATEAKQRGVRMLDSLRDGVETSINALGQGFLQNKDNRALRDRLTSGDLSTQDYYRQVLRIVYRLIFLFVAEDRNLLLVPDAPEEAKRRYRRHYATDRLRELAQRRRGSVHPDLWEQVKLIMRALGSPEGQPALALPALGSFLWDAERSTPDLADATLSNTYLLDAIRALATIRTEKEKVRRVVDYRNLGGEELGSVYESLLELHPRINLDARAFALDTSAGNERKTSGSYYTDDSLVQCLLDTALEPVIKDRLAEARRLARSDVANESSDLPAWYREAQAAGLASRPTSQARYSLLAEKALLSLKVCDPAVGSGHFLIAAGHRIARHLARIRSGEEEPSPADYQDALRDVVGRCLYGVDINPMAVELCKVSLWIEAMEPGKPLSFLDHHIRCGNSLLGTTPALIEKGIPDGAYKALTGDDAKACAFLKSRNKGEREGIGGLFVAEDSANLDALRSAAESVDAIADDSITALQRKEQEYRKAESSYERLKQKQLADLWCAAFVWEKMALEENAEGKCTKATGVTTSHLQQLAKDGVLPDDQLDQLRKLVEDYQFFHWHVEFPSVFSIPIESQEVDDEASGLTGGFDAMLGNPPWEKVKLQPKEWFAEHSPEIANARNASERKRIISELTTTDNPLHHVFQTASRRAEGASLLICKSGIYPLCGRGDLNTFAVFAELGITGLCPTGYFGAVLPPGLATDDTYKGFIQHIMKTQQLVSFFGFTNRGYTFPSVESTFAFALFTFSRGITSQAKIAAQLWNSSELSDPTKQYTISPELVNLFNPNTLNLPIIRTTQDFALMAKAYRNNVALLTEGEKGRNEWNVDFGSAFHMANDSDLFVTESRMEEHGYELISNRFVKGGGHYEPLMESKLLHQFNHRYTGFSYGDSDPKKFGTRAKTNPSDYRILSSPESAPLPRYWVNSEHVSPHLNEQWQHGWLLGYRRTINSVADSRSVVATIFPRYPASDSIFLLLPMGGAADAAIVYPMLNSLVFDYVARQKASGGNLSYYVVKQLPTVSRSSLTVSTHQLLLKRTLELTYTAWDLEPFAQDCGYDGPPFRWDEKRRFQLRCELDALFFHLYLPCDDAGDWKPARIADGAVRDETDEELATLKSHFPTPRDAVAYIMETFPIVKRKDIKRTEQKDADGNIAREGTYRTKDRILEIYDQMLQARRTGQPWQSPLDPPPGPPTDANGNFIPLAEWTNHPSHIHPSDGGKHNQPSQT